jgi:drug/metabolite transporter (DMT)-like permease
LSTHGFLPRILEEWTGRYGGNAVGAALMVMASLSNATMMASVKELAVSVPIWQILLIRSLGQSAMLLPLVISTGGTVLVSRRISFHFVRIVLSFISLMAAFYTVANLPLAEASAISFLRIIFVVALAGIVFAEKVGVIGWAATVIGLAGILIILDPTASHINAAALVGAAGALVTALVTIMVKRLTQIDATSTIMCYSSFGLAVLCAIPSIFTWQPISGALVPLFALLIGSAFVTQWCFTNAYRHGEASIMATVEYSRLIAFALIGFVIFSEVPTFSAMIGIILIVVGSFIAIRREQIRSWFNR